MPRSAIKKSESVISPAWSIQYGLSRFVNFFRLLGRGHHDYFEEVGEMGLVRIAYIRALNRHCHLFTVHIFFKFHLVITSHVSWHSMRVLIRRILFLNGNSSLVAAILLFEHERTQLSLLILDFALNFLLLFFE